MSASDPQEDPLRTVCALSLAGYGCAQLYPGKVDRAPGHSPAQEHLTLHVKNKKKKRWTKIKNMKCKRSWSSSPPITAGFALAAPGRRRQAGPAERDQERKGG